MACYGLLRARLHALDCDITTKTLVLTLKMFFLRGYAGVWPVNDLLREIGSVNKVAAKLLLPPTSPMVSKCDNYLK